MADNVEITAGSGVTVHADEYTHGTLGSGKTQLMKLVDGVLDSDTPITVDVGAKANALRVAPANDITDATYIGDIKFGESIPAGTNAIGKLAANSGVDIGDVTLNAGTAEIGKLAAGVAEIGNVKNSGTFAVQSTLQTGSAAIGKLAANTGVDIGDVDILSIAAGDNNIGNVDIVTVPAPLSVVGGGTEAAALRVTLANDSTGVITVDGTVTANLSATDNAVLDTIDAVLDTINAKLVTGTVIGDVNLGATDNAVLDAIAASLVTIDSDTNDIKVATEKIDDWDAVHASAASTDGPQIMGAGYSTALPTDVGADADAARICTDRYGRVLAGLMPQNFQATFTSADAQAATPVKTKTADRKMYILSLVVSTDTAMNIQFQDDTGPTILIEQLYLAANGGAHLTWPPEAPLVVNTNEDFDVIASAAGNISVTITGYLAV